MSAIGVVLVLPGVPCLAASGYLALLTLASRRSPAPAPRDATRFDVIVPAHDEAESIGATVASLFAVDYPRDSFRVLVVADNCRDDTAARAERAGALVLERQDTERRGKGYALAHGYAASIEEGFAQAVVVVDADSLVSRNLLSAFSARFAAGAEALQADYAVANPADSWRTRLMALAFTLFHTVRSLGRERLGLSCGLRGNGMGFRVELLQRVPPRAYSIVEDVEYGIALGLAGVRVEYVPEASVRGEMPTTAESSRTQRERWEGGRLAVARAQLPALLRAVRRGVGRIPLDLAADLLVPPLTTLAAVSAAGTALAFLAYGSGWTGPAPVVVWTAALVCLLVYVGRGVALTGLQPQLVRDLARVPAYALWKSTLALRRTAASAEWVRTARTAGSASAPARTTRATELIEAIDGIADSDDGMPMTGSIDDLLDQLTDSTGWPTIWFSVAEQSWSSLVLVPADPDLLVHPVARALSEAARLYEEQPIRFIDAENASPRQAREIAAEIRELAAQGHRTIVAVRSPQVSHPATPIARACDAAVLVVPLGGSTRLQSARQAIASVGHRSFIGAFTVGPAPVVQPAAASDTLAPAEDTYVLEPPPSPPARLVDQVAAEELPPMADPLAAQLALRIDAQPSGA